MQLSHVYDGHPVGLCCQGARRSVSKFVSVARSFPSRFVGPSGVSPLAVPYTAGRRAAPCRAIQETQAPVEAPTDTPAEQEQQDVAPFDWVRQWYPLALIEDFDPRLPHPLQLLGKDLVAWRDLQGRWNVFEDRCPHRLAPLSEGRINPEDGTLQCSYHGWRFNSTGGCVAIPQAASQEAETIAAASSRACAAVHPAKVIDGVLWVWGDGSPSAHIDAAAKDPLVMEYPTTSGKWMNLGTMFMRDLPLDYEMLLENVTDPSHVPFSHHGVQGNRNKVKYGDCAMRSLPTDNPYEVKATRDTGVLGNIGVNSSITFTAPCKVEYLGKVQKDKDEWVQFTIYMVPTRPGHSRLIVLTRSNKEFSLTARTIFAIMPPWYDHQFNRNQVLDGDNYFLAVAERQLVRESNEAGKGWRQLYYTPTAADTFVTATRQWLDRVGGGGPWGPEKYWHFSREPPTKEKALNRYEQHTQHCKVCRQTLETIRKVQSVSAALFLVCCSAILMAALTSGISSLLAPKWLACAVVAAGSGVARVVSKKIERKFIFEDYVHGLK